ncbi:MAG TPA: DUF5723 family protein [Balneolales bacterium]|nr:DUF5723 family protein [Balneolales bacterium]
MIKAFLHWLRLPSLVAMTVLVSIAAQAQNLFSSARSMALGSGGTAYVAGYRSLFINPANLGFFRGGKQIMIGLPGDLSLNAGGSLANIAVYNRYFTTGNSISPNEVNSIVQQWFGSSPDKMHNMGVDGEVVPVAAVFKFGENTVAGASLRFRTLGHVGINQGMAQFMLRGLDSQYFSQPTPVNMDQRMMSTAELALGLSHRFRFMGLIPDNQQLWVGATVQIIRGLAYSEGNFQSTLQLTDSSLVHKFDYTLETVGSMTNELNRFYRERIDPTMQPHLSDIRFRPFGGGGISKGAGYGLDIGATYLISFDGEFNSGKHAVPEKSLVLSAAVTDIGAVRFTQNPATFRAAGTFHWSGFQPDYNYINANYDSSFTNYTNYVIKDSLASDVYGAYKPVSNSAITAKLPTAIHFGAYLNLHRLGLMVDAGRGYNSYGMNSDRPYVSVGAEFYPFPFLPLRAGYRFGGKTSDSFGIGTGLEFRNFKLDISAMTVPSSQQHGYNIATAISSEVLLY